MSRPIPRKLLPDSCTFREKTGEGSRGPVYAADVTIDYVLFQRKEVKKKTQDGFEVVGKAIMIYDYKSSSPVNLDLRKVRSIIIDNTTNEEYTIMDYVDQPTLAGNHHIELTLL